MGGFFAGQETESEREGAWWYRPAVGEFGRKAPVLTHASDMGKMVVEAL